MNLSHRTRGQFYSILLDRYRLEAVALIAMIQRIWKILLTLLSEIEDKTTMSQCPLEAAFLCSSNQTCSSWSSWLIWLSCWSKLIRLAWLTWLAGVLWLAEACHLLLRTTREDDVESCQLFLFPWLYLWSFALASLSNRLSTTIGALPTAHTGDADR